MDHPRDVAVLVGSLRRASISRRIARALTLSAPPTLALDLVDLGDLPLYDEDLEVNPPASWRTMRERILRADAVLFVTPEYNRSIPGVLKNALDVGSRPYGASVWAGKPGAVVSISQGGLGGFGCNHHLRQSLVFLDVPVMQQPEAYLSHAAEVMDEDGLVVSATARRFLGDFMTAYARWVDRFVPVADAQAQAIAAEASA